MRERQREIRKKERNYAFYAKGKVKIHTRCINCNLTFFFMLFTLFSLFYAEGQNTHIYNHLYFYPPFSNICVFLSFLWISLSLSLPLSLYVYVRNVRKYSSQHLVLRFLRFLRFLRILRRREGQNTYALKKRAKIHKTF